MVAYQCSKDCTHVGTTSAAQTTSTGPTTISQYCWECGQTVTFTFQYDSGNCEVYQDAAGHTYSVAVR